MLELVSTVQFPEYSGASVNMMPFLFGEPESLPKELHGYLSILDQCELERGKVAYLTVHESFVPEGFTQRRPGVHTDGTSLLCWGGGGWGGGVPPKKPETPAPPREGIYMASTDGRCRAWNTITHDVDSHGAVTRSLDCASQEMVASHLYWMTDRTPHESLPALASGNRQFFRVVSGNVSAWWARHSTANPLGIVPNCLIKYGSKF